MKPITREDVGAVASAAGYIGAAVQYADLDADQRAEFKAYSAALNQLLSKLVEQWRAQR